MLVKLLQGWLGELESMQTERLWCGLGIRNSQKLLFGERENTHLRQDDNGQQYRKGNSKKSFLITYLNIKKQTSFFPCYYNYYYYVRLLELLLLFSLDVVVITYKYCDDYEESNQNQFAVPLPLLSSATATPRGLF